MSRAIEEEQERKDLFGEDPPDIDWEYVAFSDAFEIGKHVMSRAQTASPRTSAEVEDLKSDLLKAADRLEETIEFAFGLDYAHSEPDLASVIEIVTACRAACADLDKRSPNDRMEV